MGCVDAALARKTSSWAPRLVNSPAGNSPVGIGEKREPYGTDKATSHLILRVNMIYEIGI